MASLRVLPEMRAVLHCPPTKDTASRLRGLPEHEEPLGHEEMPNHEGEGEEKAAAASPIIILIVRSKVSINL